jgi:hypothetical protein
MTTLPATFLEARALVHAGQWIALRRREPWGAFHPDAELMYGHTLMKRWAQHPFGKDDIVYFAEHGSKEADLALREIIAEKTDKGEPLGAVLGAYNIRLVNPRRRPPGPAKAANFVRDLGITLLMAELMERFGLSPNHNPASKRPSASTVAAKALTDAGIKVPMGHKGVERIWQRYMPIFAGSSLAARSRFATGWPIEYAGLFG